MATKEIVKRTKYEHSVQDRSLFRYYTGLIARWIINLRFEYARRLARNHGAEIGDGVIMPIKLAKIANSNLKIGDHSCVMTIQLDLRAPIHIGKHVIIGHSTKILTNSHDINSTEFELKECGLKINDYAWLPAKILILPSCREIGYGCVVSSGSCVTKNTNPMTVVGGNPAKEFKKRECIHSDFVVESLQGGDYKIYKDTWNKRNKQ